MNRFVMAGGVAAAVMLSACETGDRGATTAATSAPIEFTIVAGKREPGNLYPALDFAKAPFTFYGHPAVATAGRLIVRLTSDTAIVYLAIDMVTLGPAVAERVAGGGDVAVPVEVTK